MSEKNYYEEKLLQIKNLIKDGDFEQANFLVLTELNVPYVPIEYEQKFKTLQSELKANFNMNDDKLKMLSREEITDLLLSNDREKELLALELLVNQNLRLVKEVVKHRIETWDDSHAVEKAYLFEILVDQEIDINIKFNKDVVLNPAIHNDFLSNPSVYEAINSIHQIFEKEPVLRDVAGEQLEQYLLAKYPLSIKNGKQLANEIAQVIRYMFNGGVDLSENERQIYETLQAISF